MEHIMTYTLTSRDELVKKIGDQFTTGLTNIIRAGSRRDGANPVGVMALVYHTNQQYKESGSTACASHELTDANMVMAEAFKKITGREPDVENAEDCALFNDAWSYAKEDWKKFTDYKTRSELPDWPTNRPKFSDRKTPIRP
jgi:hypothetical protein